MRAEPEIRDLGVEVVVEERMGRLEIAVMKKFISKSMQTLQGFEECQINEFFVR